MATRTATLIRTTIRMTTSERIKNASPRPFVPSGFPEGCVIRRPAGPALFDGFLIVDWSAASHPVRGANSIWCALAERGARGRLRIRLENPPTRACAIALVEAEIERFAARGRVLLAGFDFAFGYPAGFARRLGLPGLPWAGIWAYFAAALEDRADNRNNRFDLAERINQEWFAEPFPFWGHDGTRRRPYLSRRRCRGHGPGDLAERRRVDLRVPRAQPVWKLAYIGSVGSQSITGIAPLEAMRRRLAGALRLWPFETGLGPLNAGALEPGAILAEIYPSMVRPADMKPKDAGQVLALARRFASLDAKGMLAPLFAGDPALAGEERRQIEREEGWILGAGELR
jgi:precorrin-8X/cobalt-precorrin-8 methylmutase